MGVDLHMGDCLEVMSIIPDGSVDMILADLPYGTTACKWDTVIDLPSLWKHYKRVIKRNGAIVLTASQPFTSALVMSNPAMFRYEWVWDKFTPSGHLNAWRMPMKSHENVLVFYQQLPTYNPQKERRAANTHDTGSKANWQFEGKTVSSEVYGDMRVLRNESDKDVRLPKSLICFPTSNGWAKRQNDHPTQKPVALMEYLIRTYTNEGETVLDNTCGSGTTLVACINTNRNGIGIERDAGYYQIATERIERARNAYKQAELIGA